MVLVRLLTGGVAGHGDLGVAAERRVIAREREMFPSPGFDLTSGVLRMPVRLLLSIARSSISFWTNQP